MRLRRLGLKAFGGFTDLALELGTEGNFSVIYGLNEAGKSTVLRAVRDFLFGIPSRTQDAYLHDPADLRIWAVIQDEQGQEVELTRRKGTRNTLLGADGRPVDSAVLADLTSSWDREAFSLMLGLDHQSLRRGGEELLRGQGMLGEALFAAASGLGGLRELTQQLQKDAGDLFKVGGSRPPMNAKIIQHQELRAEISRLSLAPQTWAELEDRYRAEGSEVARLRQEEDALGRVKRRLERLRATLPLVARWQRCQEDMAPLHGTPILPGDFTEGRVQWLSQRNQAQQERERACQARADLEQELAGISVRTDLLEHADDIALLYERLDTYRTHRQEIPVREGEAREKEEQARAHMRQLRPGLSSLQEAESLRIPLLLVNRARELIQEHPLLVEKQQSADKQRQRKTIALRQEQEAMDQLGPAQDSTWLGQVLKQVLREGDLESDGASVADELTALRLQLAQEAAALGWEREEWLDLPSRALPAREVVQQYLQRYQQDEDEARQWSHQWAEVERQLEDYREQLRAAAAAAGQEIDETLLKEARVDRQHGWHLVRRAWLEGERDAAQERAYAGERPLVVAYETSVARADGLADRLRHQAREAQEKAWLSQELEKAQERRKSLEERKRQLERRRQALDEAWEWSRSCGAIIPRTPLEALPWLERCQRLIQDMGRLTDLGLKRQRLQERMQRHAAALKSAMQALGEKCPEGDLSLHALVNRAHAVHEALQDREHARRAHQNAHRRLQGECRLAQGEAEEAQQALERWHVTWADLLAQAELEGEVDPPSLASYLDGLRELFTLQAEVIRHHHQLEQMQHYCRDFEQRLSGLLAVLGVSGLESLSADGAVGELQRQVSQARERLARRTGLQDRRRALEEAMGRSQEQWDQAQAMLAALVEQAAVGHESELPGAEERSQRRLALREEEATLKEQLLTRGEGLSLAQLVEEASSVTADEVFQEIADWERQLEENRQSQDACNQRFGATRQEYEEKVTGSSWAALEAAEAAESVLAQLRTETEDYLRLRVASLLLRRGIERYREEHESPVLQWAGSYFARLTNDSFQGLLVDYDEKDNPVLVGVRPPGNLVPVTGMSDGTLDQLYLSLRLASLHQYLQENVPLPFILDDLLVNFDDVRAERTLELLGEFSQRTQVLFFTHHESCRDLALRVVPGCQVIELPEPSAKAPQSRTVS